MKLPVGSQVNGLSERFLTNITYVQFVNSVNAFVSGKIAEVSKCFITDITFVWFDTSMNTFMCSQTNIKAEQMFSDKCHKCMV